MFGNQKVLPAISSHQALRKFLKTDLVHGILMNFQLAQLEELVTTMHKHGRKVLVHLDMVKGLMSDEYGAIHLIQNLHIDGIISIKPRVIELCKKRNVLGIMRFFLKDSISLRQSLEIAQKTLPDALEILPTGHTHIIDRIKDKLPVDVLMGGLIETPEEIDACLSAGAVAVTTSKEALWDYPAKNR